MAQHEIELILTRQLASYLAMPIFLVDAEGDLLYFNEPAETLLGSRYEEIGEMPMERWMSSFAAADGEGNPLPPDRLPLAVALRERRPAHGEVTITGLDGVSRRIAVTAIPIEGQSGRHLGAMAIFWLAPRDGGPPSQGPRR